MPRLDGTGPDGKGRKGGRGLGRCKEMPEQGGVELGRGQGLRRNAGGGFGEGHRYRGGKGAQQSSGTEGDDNVCKE